MQQRSREELALVETARRVMPAGGFGNVSSDIIIRDGRDGRVWDESGNEYIDYMLGAGPMLIGHAHPEVNEAVHEQIAHGTGFFMNNRHGIALAEAIVEAVPCAEQVRFVCTGTEAVAYAIRLVRAFRKRDKILKFEGGFHGTSDATLMSFAPRTLSNFPEGVPDSAGIPQGVRDDILVAPYNDIDAFAGMLREYAAVLAGVLMEPVQRVIPPKPGFLEGVRELTTRHDVPLVFDEICTGFRLAYGGAQAYYGVVPDVCTLGKVLGGGYPLAAIAGREDIMAHFDATRVGPDEHLLQLGTLSGNPIAARAGLATLEVLRRPGTYERLYATGERLMQGLTERLAEQRIEATVVGLPPWFDAVFARGPIENYRDVLPGSAETERFNALLLERGVLKGKTRYAVSTAHTEQDVADTLDAWSSALAALSAESSASLIHAGAIDRSNRRNTI